MRLLRAFFQIETPMRHIAGMTRRIEKAGRTCYKSESEITQTSAAEFCQRLVKNGHHSVLEHESITVRFVVDRGVSHELVRHRLCSFSQESTRYCNYSDDHISFIVPPWLDDIASGEFVRSDCSEEMNHRNEIWIENMLRSEEAYKVLVKRSWTPQQARSVLPNSLKTEIVVTANLREWMHIFKLRCSPKAHPQMVEVMQPLQKTLSVLIPAIFKQEELKDESK